MSDVLKFLINVVVNGFLICEEVEVVFEVLFNGEVMFSQIGGFLMVLCICGEMVDEYVVVVVVMCVKCKVVKVFVGVMDIVGIGGDGKYMLNIFIVMVFVVVGVGVLVVKYGNWNLILKLGIFDLQGQMGINVMVGFEVVEKVLNEVGIGFMMVLMYYLVIVYVMLMWIEFGIWIIFNIFGFLINFVGVKC